MYQEVYINKKHEEVLGDLRRNSVEIYNEKHEENELLLVVFYHGGAEVLVDELDSRKISYLANYDMDAEGPEIYKGKNFETDNELFIEEISEEYIERYVDEEFRKEVKEGIFLGNSSDNNEILQDEFDEIIESWKKKI